MKKKLTLISFLVVLSLGSIFYFGILSENRISFGSSPLTVKSTKMNAAEFELNGKVASEQVLLENLTTGETLLEKNGDKKVAIASLTKIMTAYVLLQKSDNLQETVELNQKTLDLLTAEGASLAGFVANDNISITDLVYAIMLPSGGDAAIMAANYVSGSEKEFVKEMNQEAKKLGMKNTHFKTATGLDSRQQYSTVRDLNILIKAAMKNSVFDKVFTTFEYNTKPTDYSPEGYYLKHTLLKDHNDLVLTNGQLLGGKTGYTKDAGQCLASIAEINGQMYLLITTGAKGEPLGEQYNVIDANTIFESIPAR